MNETPVYGQGVCSWYGGYFHGRLTASGTVYDMNAMTFAHKTLPLGTIVAFRNYEGGWTIGRCTDRGPYVWGRDFDLSRAMYLAVFGNLESGVGETQYIIIGYSTEGLRYNLGRTRMAIPIRLPNLNHVLIS